uniref:S1 motif domain-containing protein n=2 Tax=Dunaliella tertiolecta TaxID=3047 RepID=A0A7S3VHF1_DUNTE|mmetsp:Transcript_27778/g.75128  ORF Transcript_27778/g.75128 Transcript_27778/m.75128 type:complete len:478 (+) Transcript_27778:137-1570(+)
MVNEKSRHRSRSRDDKQKSRHRSRSREDRRRSRSREDRHKEGRRRSREREERREHRRHRSRSRERHKVQEERGQPTELPPPPAQLPPPPNMPPPLYSIHKGTVHTIRPFGVFISIPGFRRHVLVHHSQISDDIRFAKDDVDEDKVKAMEFFLPKGQEVWVKLTEVTLDEGRGDFKLNGTLRTVNQETGEDLDPLNKKVSAVGGGPVTDEPPEEGTVHKAVVKRIEPYGVFVQLQGYRKYGLVHSSQVSSYISFSKEDSDESKKAELTGVVSIGETVYVKVVEVIPDDGTGRGPKIQCSIKLVDQASGEDLDPTNLRYKPRGTEGGMGVPGGGAAPIGSSAGTVKSGGKVEWGYLAGNDKLMPGDHTGRYQYLEDDEGAAGTSGKGVSSAQQQQQLPLPPPPSQSLPPPPSTFGSVEEALAVLEQAKAQAKAKSKERKHNDKAKKKKSKGKKDKKEKKSKKKKARSASPSSSSSSGGE